MDEVALRGIGMTSQRTRDRLMRKLAGLGIHDERVLNIMRQTPRHLFVDEALAHRAYENTALPIGHNQTISQPYIVALMTQALLAGKPLQSVLEVGSGSGYQTAILAQLVGQVYSIERIRQLQMKARQRMMHLHVHNVQFRCGDGYDGWPDRAPFDAILVAAAPRTVPECLLEQLAVGGRMVIPVGDLQQSLRVIERLEEGYQETSIETVKFVPLVHGRA